MKLKRVIRHYSTINEWFIHEEISKYMKKKKKKKKKK